MFMCSSCCKCEHCKDLCIHLWTHVCSNTCLCTYVFAVHYGCMHVFGCALCCFWVYIHVCICVYSVHAALWLCVSVHMCASVPLCSLWACVHMSMCLDVHYAKCVRVCTCVWGVCVDRAVAVHRQSCIGSRQHRVGLAWCPESQHPHGYALLEGP